MLTLLTLTGALSVLPTGTHYDDGIPTLASVVGHDFGEDITAPSEIDVYLRALAHAVPDRTRLVEYARSWEGRPLHYLAVASRDRLARLDQTKESLHALAHPRGWSAREEAALIDRAPVVTWLIHGVHGNEISSAGAALALAYHLLAAVGDPTVEEILSESVVLIDPMQNPDGRARFVTFNRFARAAHPDAEPAAVEHREPWPRGRGNHYLFDLNRDWIIGTQPETRGRLAVHLDWYPHVVVDVHEMGGDSTYFFAPPAEPANPFRSERQGHWLDTFGRENAARFDAEGVRYFVREIFDAFYPGYGTSWPVAHGAIGMTFEQASARGLRYRRRDGDVLTYGDGVRHHFTATLQTAATAARHRRELLRDFVAFRREASGGGGDVAGYAFASEDGARARRLADALEMQGIEVWRAGAAVPIGDGTVPAGSYIVPLAQPARALVENLLAPEAPIPAAFLAEQRRRLARREAPALYDVTAWNLALLFDLDWFALRTLPSRASDVATSVPAIPEAKVAYLLPWSSGTAAAVVELLRDGVRVDATLDEMRIGSRRFPSGTAVIHLGRQTVDVREALIRVTRRHVVAVVPLDSGWVDGGISLGSSSLTPLREPRVVLVWDEPAQSLSAGWARWVLEQRYGISVTAARVDTLWLLDLYRYHTIVFPSGQYSLDDGAVRQLRQWIDRGGTAVFLADAAQWATGDGVGLLASAKEKRERKDAKEKKEDAGFDLEAAIQPEEEDPQRTPGALLRVDLDREHWLSAGTDGQIQALVDGRRVFRPIRLDHGRNVGVYGTRDSLVASGIVWDDVADQIAQKAFVIHQPLGRGHVVAFAEDPNYRGYAEATQLLFVNAVLLAPAN